MKQKHYTIPIFIPELACPFQCVYCNQRKISGQRKVPDKEEIIITIEDHLKTIPPDASKIEIGFFGGNFTGLPLDNQRHFLEIAYPYFENNKVDGFRLSTRPDYINKEVLDLLKEYKVETIELGAQSLDDEVLQKSVRGHTSEDVVIAARLIKNYGFRLGLQMMIGLPGDTFAKSFKTAQLFNELGAMDTRIYPCLVIKGTELEVWYKQGEYVPIPLKTAIGWSKEIFKYFEATGINVIRIGLHPSEGLLTGKELVAGPFHPSFKELMLTSIWEEILRPLIWIHEHEKLIIAVPPDQINYAVGYKSENRKMLLKHFKEVKFRPDLNLQAREFRVTS